jgi:hypothetical protein
MEGPFRGSRGHSSNAGMAKVRERFLLLDPLRTMRSRLLSSLPLPCYSASLLKIVLLPWERPGRRLKLRRNLQIGANITSELANQTPNERNTNYGGAQRRLETGVNECIGLLAPREIWDRW